MPFGGIVLNKNTTDKLINKLTEKGLIKDLYKIANKSNIIIHESYLGDDSGFYFYAMRTKTILLNHRLSYYKKQIVLAHEIAHATLHPYEEAHFTSISIQKPGRKENEANYFACKLLDIIGFWDNDELCIYEHELDSSDLGFVYTYKNYLKEREYNGETKC